MKRNVVIRFAGDNTQNNRLVVVVVIVVELALGACVNMLARLLLHLAPLLGIVDELLLLARLGKQLILLAQQLLLGYARLLELVAQLLPLVHLLLHLLHHLDAVLFILAEAEIFERQEHVIGQYELLGLLLAHGVGLGGEQVYKLVAGGHDKVLSFAAQSHLWHQLLDKLVHR